MIIENAIKNRIEESKGRVSPFIRNILKEELQNFVLNFVYTSKYKSLIFTGGTSLRKNYGLNRLSEDLNFDYINNFDINEFSKDVIEYFKKSLNYKFITTKISTNQQSIYLKFPILKELGLLDDVGTPEDLFLRCDFSKEISKIYSTETNLIKAGQYEFFCLSYDLQTLFANKIVATIERVYFKGKYQKVPSKGRDIYDLFWLIQLSAKTSYALKPNMKRIFRLLDIQDSSKVKELIKKKIEIIEENYLYQDLRPLLESKELLESFKKNFKTNIIQKLDFIM